MESESKDEGKNAENTEKTDAVELTGISEETGIVERTDDKESKKQFFKLTHPNGKTWFVTLIVIILLVLSALRIEEISKIYFTILIIMIIVAPPLWSKVNQLMLDKFFLKNFELFMEESADANTRDNVDNEGKKNKNRDKKEQNLKNSVKIINAIIGLDINPEKKYYLESEGSSVDLNDYKTLFYDKIFHTLGAGIGITFLIAYLVDFLVKNPESVYIIITLTTCFSPLLVAFLVPFIWTVTDSGIRIIEKNKIIDGVGEKMSRGILKKLLGWAGILIGIGFLYSFFDSFPAVSNQGFVAVAYNAVEFFMIFLFMNGGVSSIVCVIYLVKYHEKTVIQLRTELEKFMEVGTAELKTAN